MNSIQINTMNKQKEYRFEKCRLVTNNYSVRLKKNEIHSPSAAKLIVENRGIIKAFILKQPIIKVDKKGDVVVLTTMQWKDATFSSTSEYSKKEKSLMIHTRKLLQAKKSIGLSFDEIFAEKDLQSELDIIRLKNKKLQLDKGGGF